MSAAWTSATARLPRASGGVSVQPPAHVLMRVVFPAQAGVFPPDKEGLPQSSPSSPRKRGCFLGRHRGDNRAIRLPRASGGVSISGRAQIVCGKSSPRKRGCFLNNRINHLKIDVFPAQAGVFLEAGCTVEALPSLPRASGGVSNQNSPTAEGGSSSPRKRGCFDHPSALVVPSRVFPAQAGVFPTPK